MRNVKAAAAAAVGVVIAASALLGAGAGQAHAATSTVPIYGQLNNNALAGVGNYGSSSVTMTVSPASAAAGAPIEVQVSSDLVFTNGPAVPAGIGSEEIDAVIVLNGQSYTLRGSQNEGCVAISKTLFSGGWVVSSTPGNSSASIPAITTTGSGCSAGTATGSKGVGATKQGAEGTAVALVAPAVANSYTIGLKAIALNAVSGSSSAVLTDPFDDIFNSDPGKIVNANGANTKVANCAPPGTGCVGSLGAGGISPDDTVANGGQGTGSFYNDTAADYISAASGWTPVTLVVTGGSTSSPTDTATGTPTNTATSTPTNTATSTPSSSTSTTAAGSNLPSTVSKTYKSLTCSVVGVNEAWSGAALTLALTPKVPTGGSNVTVTLTYGQGPKNGPIALPAGGVEPKATVLLGGSLSKTILLTGPKLGAIAISAPLPGESLTGSFVFPATSGAVVSATLQTVAFDSGGPSGLGTTFTWPAHTDLYDTVCNAADEAVNNSAKTTPVAIGLAAGVPYAGTVTSSTPSVSSGSSSGTNSGGGSLAATGPQELVAIAVLAFVVLQFGAIFTVRAVRAGPRGSDSGRLRNRPGAHRGPRHL